MGACSGSSPRWDCRHRSWCCFRHEAGVPVSSATILLTANHEGERYLVSVTGDEAQWVRNARAANGAVRRCSPCRGLCSSAWQVPPRLRGSAILEFLRNPTSQNCKTNLICQVSWSTYRVTLRGCLFFAGASNLKPWRNVDPARPAARRPPAATPSSTATPPARPSSPASPRRNGRATWAASWTAFSRGIRHGRRRAVRLEEVPVEQRAPVLKAYLKWALGAQPLFEVSHKAPLEEFEGIAERHPVFRIVNRSA